MTRDVLDPCKICGASVTNHGDNLDGDNVSQGVCYLCFRSPLYHPEHWR